MTTYAWTVRDTSDGVNFHDALIAEGEAPTAQEAGDLAWLASRDAHDAAGVSLSHYSDETGADGTGEIRQALSDDSEITVTITEQD